MATATETAAVAAAKIKIPRRLSAVGVYFRAYSVSFLNVKAIPNIAIVPIIAAAETQDEQPFFSGAVSEGALSVGVLSVEGSVGAGVCCSSPVTLTVTGSE